MIYYFNIIFKILTISIIYILQHEKWIDNDIECEMKQILEICIDIRGIKSVQHILKKHGPKSR